MTRFRILKDGRTERGTALVEFSLVAGLLMFFIYAIVAFGLILSQKNSITQAATEGARSALSVPGIASPTEAERTAHAMATVADTLDWMGSKYQAGDTTAIIDGCTSPADPARCITVTITYPYEDRPLVAARAGPRLDHPERSQGHCGLADQLGAPVRFRLPRLSRLVRNRARDERGAVLIILIPAIVMTVFACALGVDVGRIAVDKRNDQSVADVAALDAARALSPLSSLLAHSVYQSTAQTAAEATAARNGFDRADQTVTATVGSINPLTNDFVETGNTRRARRGGVVLEARVRLVRSEPAHDRNRPGLIQGRRSWLRDAPVRRAESELHGPVYWLGARVLLRRLDAGQPRHVQVSS